MKTLFIVTHNIAGYMPEADPAVFETFADAKSFAIDEMREAAARVEPGTPDPFGEFWAEELIDAAKRLSLVSGDYGWDWGEAAGTGPESTHLHQWWAITKTVVSDEEAAELMGEMA